MTVPEEERAAQIASALNAYYEKDGVKDTLRIDLRGAEILPVVEVPLDMPVLNADSFRIAPQLNDHPRVEIVRGDPESDEAQAVIAELVRGAHRHAEDLRLSLREEDQTQAGVITRSGKLINANTRCVLLRELRDAGETSVKTLRVAVLPQDFTSGQELELESVLQKQREHKDEYSLVGELMMIQKLYAVAKMTDAEINRLLRVKGGEKRVTDLRAVLDLMERARQLTSQPMTLSDFISKEDKQENWLGLLQRVRIIDAQEGRPAGDDHIRRWLIAYTVGLDSVHTLRAATGSWIEDDVLPDLEKGDDVAITVAQVIRSELDAVPPAEGESNPGEDTPTGLSRTASPLLDLLGSEPEQSPSASSDAVKKTLDIVVAAKRAGTGTVEVGDDHLAAADVTQNITASVRRGLDRVRRRNQAGSRLQRPASAIDRAIGALRDAADAIDDVYEEAAFQRLLPGLRTQLGDAITLVQSIDETIGVSSDGDLDSETRDDDD
jgi:hypothetical protein